MLVYANEFPESENTLDSEYDTLVQQNTEIISQNKTIIEGLEKLDTTCGMVLAALLISMAWRFGTYIVHSLFGSS